MKITVIVQYVGHVVHAGGQVTYRSVTFDLTDDQAKKLRLHEDEYFGSIMIESNEDEGETK